MLAISKEGPVIPRENVECLIGSNSINLKEAK